MNTINAPDGTPLAYARLGSGPPLVLVHGTAAANPTAWTSAIPPLAEQFTLYALTRRGREPSGDGPVYALEREFEDIAALVDAIRTPAFVLGHSFGALVVLGAALRTRSMRKMILYEPALPLPGQPPVYPPGSLEKLQALFDAGEQETALVTFYSEVAELQPEEIEALRATPQWSARVQSAHTLLREAQAEYDYRYDPRQFEDLPTPTLLMVGSESPERVQAGCRALHAVLPNSRLAVLPGQQHIAMYTAPEMFVRTVRDFLLEAD